ncbi:MAG: hypothetical protein V5804_01705, partial [Mucilaginibacter sp.]|uniref:hypothetical protein n=1 Tax=Mucilaginibacter sp. TaxID=1882438 RepID=UPI0034E4CB6D
MCIYYLDQANLNYFKREHIIPAGLGGREMLAQGIVSDEFNLSMAGLEKDYMNNSLYAGFARILLGPGQRGSLSPNKEVRSDVHVLVNKDDNSDVSLGYIQKGKTYELTQIRVNTLNNK